MQKKPGGNKKDKKKRASNKISLPPFMAAFFLIERFVDFGSSYFSVNRRDSLLMHRMFLLKVRKIRKITV
jgi:hypothetical protein